jgi:hypothetical protein
VRCQSEALAHHRGTHLDVECERAGHLSTSKRAFPKKRHRAKR